MKSHHTTLHQFTLLSRRGVRLHLKNQAQQESLKKHFLKTLIISPNPSILEIILCHQVLHWKNRKKKDSHSPQLHATTFAAFTFNYEKLSTVTPCL